MLRTIILMHRPGGPLVERYAALHGEAVHCRRDGILYDTLPRLPFSASNNQSMIR